LLGLLNLRAGIRMQSSGHTFRQISDALAYGGRRHARRAIERAMLATVAEPAAEARALELDRLSRLQAAAWTQALAGDTRSIEIALRIIDRRCKLLGAGRAGPARGDDA
jgi:hypothetical protein